MPAQMRVRMYRVGFGDCFLLSLPVGQGVEHVLVDCGVHPQANLGTFDLAMDDIAATTGGKLALVVATHEHADHISGFGKYRQRFAGFEIGEVWMPWALDPTDPGATGVRERRAAALLALQAHFAAVGASGAARAALLNLQGNAPAVEALRSGFSGAGRPRYFEMGASPKTPIAGLTIDVLGPPRDEAFLRRMDPPKPERFFRAGVRGASGDPATRLLPFLKRWTIEDRKARKLLGLSAKAEQDLEGALSSAEGMAFAIDSAVNNTSLVLLLGFRGHHLLFPGDAQYGNWQAWLEQPMLKAKLANVSFLKVAHHGSLNATPRSALEALPKKGFVAMVATQSKPWKSIPQKNLMDALAKRGRATVRSDSLEIAGAPLGPALAKLPKGFKRGQPGEPWIDYQFDA